MTKCVALILCAGKGTRTGLNQNKILHMVGSKTVIEKVMDVYSPIVDEICIVHSRSDKDAIMELCNSYPNVRYCEGGGARAQSVMNGLKEVNYLGANDIVIIHDGARPYVTERLIRECIDSAIKHGSGIAAVNVTNAVKVRQEECIIGDIDRDMLVQAQTPQAFRYGEISKAYSRAHAYVDDSEAYLKAGFSPKIVEGDYSNIKITHPSDLYMPSPHESIGIGFDVHRLVVCRPLIIGGIKVPYELGLDGHSDADVLAHAVTDAVLSGASQPDIGTLFPDTDPAYLGADSMELLGKAMNIAKQAGYTVASVSAVIIAQRPHMAEYIQAMRQRLADVMQLDSSHVNISATTTEHMGIIGNGEAIAASATALMRR